MSAIAFDWVPARTETKANIPPKAAENYSRQEEFRLALDRYIVHYVAHQRRRDEALGGTVGMRSSVALWRGSPVGYAIGAALYRRLAKFGCFRTK